MSGKETEQTVNDDEAKDQWKNFASGKSDFYLVVPKNSLDDTKALAEKYNVIIKGYLTY